MLYYIFMRSRNVYIHKSAVKDNVIPRSDMYIYTFLLSIFSLPRRSL